MRRWERKMFKRLIKSDKLTKEEKRKLKYVFKTHGYYASIWEFVYLKRGDWR